MASDGSDNDDGGSDGGDVDDGDNHAVDESPPLLSLHPSLPMW